jgi:hypothetical protein
MIFEETVFAVCEGGLLAYARPTLSTMSPSPGSIAASEIME